MQMQLQALGNPRACVGRPRRPLQPGSSYFNAIGFLKGSSSVSCRAANGQGNPGDVELSQKQLKLEALLEKSGVEIAADRDPQAIGFSAPPVGEHDASCLQARS